MNSPLTHSNNCYTGQDDTSAWDQIQPFFVCSDQLTGEQPSDKEPASSGSDPVGGELVHAGSDLKKLPVKEESRNELVLRGISFSSGNSISRDRVLPPDRIPGSRIAISSLPITERIGILGLMTAAVLSVAVLLVSYAESESVLPSSASIGQPARPSPSITITAPLSAAPAAVSSPTPSAGVSSPAAAAVVLSPTPSAGVSAPAGSSPTAPAVVSSPTASALNELVTGLNEGDITTLIKRGQDLLKHGDFAAARVLFTRAADTGSAQAALALASTYDPAVIKQLGAVAVRPDIDRALTWYATAADRGSVDAAERYASLARARLELLASDAMIK